jgi:hypothetical protein
LGAAAVWACRMFCTSTIILTQCPYFKLIFGHSIALRRTSTGSTLPFAVACAPYVGRESEVDSFLGEFDDSNREICAALSIRFSFGVDALT